MNRKNDYQYIGTYKIRASTARAYSVDVSAITATPGSPVGALYDITESGQVESKTAAMLDGSSGSVSGSSVITPALTGAMQPGRTYLLECSYTIDGGSQRDVFYIIFEALGE